MIDGVWEAEPQRLKSCLEEVKRLSKLIEDMRVLTGLEWEKITLHKTNFDMRELLECAGEQFIPAAKEKGIDLRLETRMPDTTIAAKTIVNADYDRIKQVIINLISNAVKYTDTGHITISISDGGEGAAVKIEDTGVGIAKEDLPHIFDRFYRADKSRNSLTGGSGIGLTIASSIATAHGWALSAESEVGRGTVFTLLIR
jgi:signal transduction histidine kinase